MTVAALLLAAGAAIAPPAVAAPDDAVNVGFVWGDNVFGQLGDGGQLDSTRSPVPLSLPGGAAPAAVSAGDEFGTALGPDGTVYSWGLNNGGELGLGDFGGRATPTAVRLPVAATAISAGAGGAMALGADGRVYAWGTYVGDGTDTINPSPTAVTLPGTNPVAISAGYDFDLALAADGSIYAWGDNSAGQIGDGTDGTEQLTPETIHLPGGVAATAIAAGWGSSLAVGADGRVYSWGDNYWGELGDGTTDSRDRPAPIALPGGAGARSVASGSGFGLAVGTEGQVYTWGWNRYNELGDGTTVDHYTPERVALPDGVSAVSASAGYDSTLVVGDDGKLYGWGLNQNGELGDGTADQRATPEPIPLPGGVSATQVSVAFDASIAVGRSTPGAPQFVTDTPPLTVAPGAHLGYTFVADGYPLASYGLADGAPDWLRIDPDSGVLTGTVPAGVTSFSYAVTATNSLGSATAGPFTVWVGGGAPISGRVLDDGGTPVAGAAVDACSETGCATATSGADGSYSVEASAGISVTLVAYPPSSAVGRLSSTTAGPFQVPDGGLTDQTLTLPPYGTLAGGTRLASVDNGPVPVVNWAQPAQVQVPGCADGIATASVIGDDDSGNLDFTIVPLSQDAPGSGQYSGDVPPLWPMHGSAQLRTSVWCPPVSDLAPNAGPADGGTDVLLTGSGFTGATEVTFGGTPTTFTVLSDQSIRAAAPAGAGTVDVAVTTAGGTPTTIGQYTYLRVTSVGPGNGPPSGGTAVTITGTGLGTASQVTFGTVPALITSTSDTAVQVVAPAGQGTQDVRVVTRYGTTPVTAADRFTYTGTAGSTAAPAVLGPVAPRVTSQATAATPAAARPAISVDAAATIIKTVNALIPKLLTANDLNTFRTALRKAMADQTCESGHAMLKAEFTVLAGPLGDAMVEEILPEIIAAEAASAAVTFPLLALIVPLTIIEVNAAVSIFVETAVDDAVDAVIGECPRNTPGGEGGADAYTPNFLIDPSGTVQDTHGNPVPGATVTLLRAGSQDGPFTADDPTGPGIQPAVNPETTGPDGGFHWDVSAGWYEVRASAPGCADPADPDRPPVTIGPYPVPPPQVGLTITMRCDDEAPAPVPDVTAVSPGVGPAGGGTTVLVTGDGFTSASQVAFGSAPAASVAYLSPHALRVVTPAGHGGTDLVVTTAGGSSATGDADRFYFGAAPTVTGLDTAQGPAAGGTPVTITGTGFTGATGVSFAGVAATGVTVVSDTRITATAPAGTPGPADVVVANPAGASATGDADRYTYLGVPAPAFTAATPPLTGTVGTGYGYAFAATGAPTYALRPGAPSWLSIDPASGAVTGTPPAGTGSFSYAVTATNASGSAGAGPFTVTVAARSATAPPTVDAQATGAGSGPLTVQVTTATAGDLLVAFVAADGPGNNTKQKATVSGGGLTWTLAGRTTAQYGTAEVWTARVPEAGTTVSVRSAMSIAGYQQQLTVVAFGSSAGIGTVAGASARTGAPHATVTTTGDASWVFAVGNDWDRSANRIVDSGQTLVAQATDSVGDTYWVQSTTGPTADKGTAVTIGDIAPTNDRWNLTTVEILGSGA